MKLHILLIFPTLLALSAWSLAHAVEPPPVINEGLLTLVNEPGYNEIDVTLKVGISFLTYSDSDTTTFTGDMQAKLAIL